MGNRDSSAGVVTGVQHEVVWFPVGAQYNVGVALTSKLHLVLRLRKTAATHSLPYAFLACIQTTLTLLATCLIGILSPVIKMYGSVQKHRRSTSFSFWVSNCDFA